MNILFQKDIKRLALLNEKLQPNDVEIKIAVYRNHSFEMVANVLNVFLNFSKIGASFLYSDYDDSLNFQVKEDADLNIVWIDSERYKTDNLDDFLQERAMALRALSKAPILIAYTGKKININTSVPDTYFVCVNDWLVDLENIYDLEKEAYSGTRLSNKALLECARVLGLKYIPAIVQTPLKAIVCDLDNTLYQGILGEDGIDALVPNLALQKKIKSLKEAGFFICIASKNEEEDVKKMFEKRKDFILSYDDFTAVEINWDSKADNILKLVKKMNIGLDSVLFIDDNPAEIQNVEPTGVHTLLADENVVQKIKYYSGLLKLKHNKEDNLRAKDIQANAQRLELSEKLTPKEYFEKLEIRLSYHINDKNQIARVAELFGKTNQFILTYKRYNETQVNAFMTDADKCIVTILMSDKLSDSGVIALLAAHKEKEDLFLDELTVSCRALGRNLENVMLPKMFQIAQEKLKTSACLFIPYKKGERNAPALTWLSSLVKKQTSDEGVFVYDIPPVLDVAGLIIEVS